MKTFSRKEDLHYLLLQEKYSSNENLFKERRFTLLIPTRKIFKLSKCFIFEYLDSQHVKYSRIQAITNPYSHV